MVYLLNIMSKFRQVRYFCKWKVLLWFKYLKFVIFGKDYAVNLQIERQNMQKNDNENNVSSFVN